MLVIIALLSITLGPLKLEGSGVPQSYLHAKAEKEGKIINEYPSCTMIAVPHLNSDNDDVYFTADDFLSTPLKTPLDDIPKDSTHLPEIMPLRPADQGEGYELSNILLERILNFEAQSGSGEEGPSVIDCRALITNISSSPNPSAQPFSSDPSNLTKVNPDENGDQVVVTLLLPIAQIIAKYIRKILLTVTPL
ncbi:hypothetical protein C1646_776186 [Rhizophagus diaphanus]|nr:hypothetical protein C1646_776186 [Rhizophagus diaphanus] [Rhizophagus sp. MUCL 43196]